MIKMCCSVVVVCVGSYVLSGCETSQVKPWQRGDLARAEMAWEPDPMESSFRDHVYTSKEGSSGGVGTGGGGCGCY